MKRIADSAQDDGAAGRGFGMVMGVAFLVIGIWPAVFGGSPTLWALLLAAVCLILAVARPTLLRGPRRVWLWVGDRMGQIMGRITMAVIFFLVVTPTGLVLRALGKDILSLRADPMAESHWIDRPSARNPADHLTTQF